MAKAAARVARTPGKLRLPQQAVKIECIELIKDFFQIEAVSVGGGDALASAHLANQVSLRNDLMAGDIFAVTDGMAAGNGLTIKFGQQDMGNGVQHRIRSAFEQAGKPGADLALAQADGVMHVGKGKKLHLNFRY